jgi:7-carboxy-7-deazaguanine synthase
MEILMFKYIEMFHSIQGESQSVGMNVVFLRLAKCNLACSFCDSKYSWKEGIEISVDEVIYFVKESRANGIVITGGEPLLHPETPQLVESILNAGISVLVETNGTFDIGALPKAAVKSVDIKTPSSGFAGSFLESNIELLGPHDAIKFVIADRADFDWAVSEAERLGIFGRKQVVFSPVADRLSPSILADWIMDSRKPARLSVQLHKILGLP